jgi:shikimate dehydrogenase
LVGNIALIGLAGCGKTTLGRDLARRLGRDFLDLDSWIEQHTGRTITSFFAAYGEDFFRQIEAEAVRRAVCLQDTVIATGGGVVLSPENVRLLRENSLVILIDRPVEDILETIGFGERPLLRGGAEALYRLAKSRESLYHASAHLVFQNSGDRAEALENLAVLAEAASLSSRFAVIGSPIGHTLSPPIHHAVFGALGIEESYAAMHVPKGRLRAFLSGAKYAGLRGFNATIPHKQDILPLLDEVDEDARFCGAVNTVTLRDGKLCGFNTDMAGLLQALQNAGSGYRDRRVLLLGAGGAATGIACKAAREGAKTITILARRKEQAEAVGAIAQKAGGAAILAGILHPAEMETAAGGCDLLLNATPLGMAGVAEDFPSLAFVGRLPDHALVCDLIYNPAQTKLLEAAANRGLRTLGGLDMLIHQALLADELFLGQTLDKHRLYEIVRGALAAKPQNKEVNS